MAWIETIFASIFLFILPGWALLSLLGKNNRLELGEKIGLSAGLSVCLYPILFLFCSLIHIAPGYLSAWIPGISAAGFLLTRFILSAKSQQGEPGQRPGIPLSQVLFLFITGLLFLSRMLVIQSMIAPAWGDSVQHTFIVRLMLDHEGLFQSWSPYAPMESFTYHFGFHAATSAWAWLTGESAIRAVLTCGQIMNVLAILALYPLARFLTGRSRSGLCVMVVAGLLFPMPGYYVNWGRYTQLAGQIILPVAVWLIALLWVKKKRPVPGLLILITITLLGLALTHYLVTVLLIAATAALILYGLWIFRQDFKSWATRTGLLTLCGSLGIFAFFSWAMKFSSSRIPNLIGRSAGYISDEHFITDLPIWGETNFYFHYIFWIVALFALLAAFLKRPILAIFIFLWSSFSFALANPQIFNIPGRGFLSNEFLLFALYIPITLLTGWLMGFIWITLDTRKIGRVFAFAGLIFLLASGMILQLQIIDPFFHMVMPEDLEAFQWIRSNTSKDAYFLVNGFLVHHKSSVVGSDSGWWLPYFTQRRNNVPPILYKLERLSPAVDRENLKGIIKDIRASNGNPDALRALFLQEGFTHVFLGERRGSVGYNQRPLIQEAWFIENPDFVLVYQIGKAQIWKFKHDFKP
jgi:hypothetical protein